MNWQGWKGRMVRQGWKGLKIVSAAKGSMLTVIGESLIIAPT